MDVVSMLNSMYTKFDKALEKHDVYKVKIGHIFNWYTGNKIFDTDADMGGYRLKKDSRLGLHNQKLIDYIIY